MNVETIVDELLEQACPSIQYRLRREILNHLPSDRQMMDLQKVILLDNTVQEVMNQQQSDGWLAWDFHGTPGTESGIRLLCEKGVDSNHPVLANALRALETYTDRLDRGIGKVGRLLDFKFGGSFMIRASLFARAGVEDKPFVKEQIDKALEGFRAVHKVNSIEDVAVSYRGKLVFKLTSEWPSLYHLRLLAFTQGWRTHENRTMLAKAIHRLIELSPIPDIYIRYKSQLIAPASVFMHDFNPDMATMDPAQWMGWFHRVELLSRLGVVSSVPPLKRQVDTLNEMLIAGGGWFTRKLTHDCFRKWGAYPGLMLEKDWKSPARRIFDLTFRSLLILHYAGLGLYISPARFR